MTDGMTSWEQAHFEIYNDMIEGVDWSVEGGRLAAFTCEGGREITNYKIGKISEDVQRAMIAQLSGGESGMYS